MVTGIAFAPVVFLFGQNLAVTVFIEPINEGPAEAGEPSHFAPRKLGQLHQRRCLT